MGESWVDGAAAGYNSIMTLHKIKLKVYSLFYFIFFHTARSLAGVYTQQQQQHWITAINDSLTIIPRSCPSTFFFSFLFFWLANPGNCVCPLSHGAIVKAKRIAPNRFGCGLCKNSFCLTLVERRRRKKWNTQKKKTNSWKIKGELFWKKRERERVDVDRAIHRLVCVCVHQV